jgi:hypothetical protein
MENKEIKTEICVSCGLNTHVDKKIDISVRIHYIEGAGQLCKDCYDNIFKGVKNDVPNKF